MSCIDSLTALIVNCIRFFLTGEEFRQCGFLYQIVYMVVSSSLLRWKYYFAWKLSENSYFFGLASFSVTLVIVDTFCAFTARLHRFLCTFMV